MRLLSAKWRLSNLPRLALSAKEVAEILRASGKIAILVGGQALSIWAYFYQVAIPAALAANVTRDADFIGSADTALMVKAALRAYVLMTTRPIARGNAEPTRAPRRAVHYWVSPL